MKILIFGAGIIGSVLASKLHDAGIDVTLLARGERFDSLKKNGIIINDILNKTKNISKVPLIDALNTNDDYDLIIISVRYEQLQSAIESVKLCKKFSSILFMLNYPDSLELLSKEFPDKKILLGFPGYGGTYNDGEIDYIQLNKQKTTIGSLDSRNNNFINDIKNIFEKSGIQTEIHKNMQDWLIIHAVFISCIAASIVNEGGDSVALGRNKNSVRRLVESVREGFKACQKLGIEVTPTNLKTIFITMPKWFSVMYWQKALQGEMGTLAMAPHANSAKHEMKLLAKQTLKIVNSSGLPSPNINKLLNDFITK